MQPTLRITQSAKGADNYHVELTLEGDGLVRQAATASFTFEMTAQDHEDLRWYLEDYLQYPHDPAPTIAARVEERMREIGTELFDKVFQAERQARDLWAKCYERLSDIRVEVNTGVQEATAIPWELIRDPHTDTALTLRVRAFVRTHDQPVETPRVVETQSGPIRILLVICRPKQADDVPFRSVASRLVKSLTKDVRVVFQLDVLRPPTYEQLAATLRQAKQAGRPYHVVHFDGHGMYAELADDKSAAEGLRSLIPFMLSGPREGSHGYLLFEDPTVKDNLKLVDGDTLGKLLRETDVPVLVLIACRSAHSEAPEQPQTAGSSSEIQAQVRALGSLAQEVINTGVTGVVAMRYNVYVVTAAQFVGDLYTALVQGTTLGQAVTLGRKQLADNPQREIAYEPRRLEDWSVPIVYEAMPTAIFPENEDAKSLSITVDAGGASGEAGALDDKLPKPPDAGFFGRDETLLALDRAFDNQRIVLLHAYAGSGKTTTAAEFARWYSLTGGVKGPVLFTSFEQYLPLARVLDRLGEVFEQSLEQANVNWLTLDDADRRNVALDVLNQIPILWIWDNVEPVAGFPTGTESAWSKDEQRELVDFLRDAAQTKAKFLLTSRRDERPWLGDELPMRIAVPPMPMQERVQLARAMAERHGHRLTDVDDWRPLLRFTGGNPLTITVLVGQALRDGLKSREQIEAFVDKLRRGEQAFDDEMDQGRSRSLGASLAYGFENAFSETERKQLACLHLFQGFVDVDVLRLMGNHDDDWYLPELRDLTRESGIALLDRAAEVGLLTAHGNRYYTIHPALPWFFKNLFDQHFPAPESGKGTNSQSAVARAFVEAMGALGNHYHKQYFSGNSEVIGVLNAEEANLLHARRLARAHGWWRPVLGTMQGLRSLYGHTGRRAEWRRLVDEIVPDFVDPSTDGPLPGQDEEDWNIVTDYRMRLEEEARHWEEAERLQHVRVDWSRKAAAGALELEPEALNDTQRNRIRTLAVSLNGLGDIQRERQQSKCVASYEDSLVLSERIGARTDAAACAFNLGHAYKDVRVIRDLEKAEEFYRRSLNLYEEHQRHYRAMCLGQMGAVPLIRFRKARAAGKPKEELHRHINAALKSYQQALELLPDDAINDLALTHSRLGAIYGDVGEMDRALPHYRDAIHMRETAGDRYGAALTRLSVAIDLAKSGRVVDAREYALAALQGFATFGDGAADKIQETQELIAMIEKDIAKGGSS